MTTTARKLRFGAFMSVPSCHPTGWRHPDAIAETDLSLKLLLTWRAPPSAASSTACSSRIRWRSPAAPRSMAASRSG